MRRPALLTAALATALLASGCGATVASTAAPATTGFPVTVQNCGAPLTLDAAPTRVVSNDVGITEMLFALGLEDRMAGYTIDQQDQSLTTSPWREQFAAVPRLGRDLTKEVVQGANADLVYAGWNYGFRDSSGVTPEAFAALGTPSYVLTESCRQPGGTARGIMAPLDALYTDITNLGALFGVPDRAAALVAQYRRTVDAASASVPPQRPRPKVFLYDGGTDAPFTSGRYAGPQEIIAKAGGDNIFGTLENNWTTVSWEPVVAANPDVIIINDYGTPSAAQKIAFLESFAPLAGVTAVKEKRFFVLPYAALVESPRNPQAIADFAAYLNARR